MNSTTWKRAKQVFNEALEKSGPERSGFVAAACGADRDLRFQVHALLKAHDEAGEFLDSPTVPEANQAVQNATTLTATPPTERPGATIGRYKLLQVIGEGGFGVVYMAEQEEPVRRRVALKVIKLGMDTKQVIARFEAERQALALMEHPNIARVLDAGATETGRPYFVMELVKGVPITEYCDTNTLTTRERLDLFTEVCGAVQHAHQKGIIHRDLKPSNVLVTLHDGMPVPKVIDFGIAKATHQRLTEKTLFTEYGQFIGTPVYMSPEQAEMSGLDVDTRSDIYSLGVLLYELLTGTTPFQLEDLRAAGYGELQRIIREEEPPKPSTRLSTLGGTLSDIAKHRKTDPGGLTRLVRGDLDWIVMQSLEKDRTRRYESASEFAADVARHLADDPVLARPPSTAYMLRKYVKKHKGPVASVAAVVATALILGSVAFWQGRVAQQQGVRVRANGILVAAEATEDPLTKALLVSEVADLSDLPGRLRVARDVADYPLPLAVLRGHDGYLLDVDISPDSSRVATASSDGTVRVWRLDGVGKPLVLRGHDGAVIAVEFSPDGRIVLTGSQDGTARLWRSDGSGDPLVVARHGQWVRSAEFSADGSQVVTASNDGTARVWRADGTGEAVVLRGHESPIVRQAVFSPDGTRVATASSDGTARIWRADGSGNPEILRHDSQVVGVVFGPDGSRVATYTEDTVNVWHSDGSGDPVVLRPEGPVRSVDFSPDGQRVVTASGSGSARVWRVDGTGEPVILQGSGGMAARFSPGGTRVVTALADGTAQVWTDGCAEPVVLGRHDGALDDVAISPDGTRVVTISHDGTARVWDLDARGETVVLRGHGSELSSVAFSSEGSRVMTTSIDGTARIWRSDGTGDPVVLSVGVAAFDPDGSRVVTGSRDGAARIWPADGSGEPVELVGHRGGLWDVAFSPDGTKVVTASLDGTARVWNADGTEAPVVLRGHDAGVSRVAFDPDGSRVIGICVDGSVRIWRADGTSEPIVFPGPEQGVFKSTYRVYDDDSSQWRVVHVIWDGEARVWRDEDTNEPVVAPDGGIGLFAAYWSPEVAISPDGSSVLVASTGTLWSADGSGDSIVLPGQQGIINAAFSPDGRSLVAVNGGVRLWRADWTAEPTSLRGHTSEVYHAAFSPDGTRVVTGSFDATARVWNTDGTGEPIVLRGHSASVFRVAFSSDGSRVAAASWDGTARIWRVTWPGLLDYIRKNLHACLTPEQRMKFLAESPTEARKTYASCERAQGREPDSRSVAPALDEARLER